MKTLLLILGIVCLVACALSLLFSAFYRLGYYRLMDGTSDLYKRLRLRMFRCFVIGIVSAVVGIVCIFISFKL